MGVVWMNQKLRSFCQKTINFFLRIVLKNVFFNGIVHVQMLLKCCPGGLSRPTLFI